MCVKKNFDLFKNIIEAPKTVTNENANTDIR